MPLCGAESLAATATNGSSCPGTVTGVLVSFTIRQLQPQDADELFRLRRWVPLALPVLFMPSIVLTAAVAVSAPHEISSSNCLVVVRPRRQPVLFRPPAPSSATIEVSACSTPRTIILANFSIGGMRFTNDRSPTRASHKPASRQSWSGPLKSLSEPSPRRGTRATSRQKMPSTHVVAKP